MPYPSIIGKLSYTKHTTMQLPPTMKRKSLVILLLLCGDVASNPGPTKFGFVNCRSIRNKGPLIHDLVHSGGYQILGLTETHISPSDTDRLLRSVTPTNYSLVQKPRFTSKGGGVGFLYHKSISTCIIPSPDINSFECVVVSFSTNHSKFFAVLYTSSSRFLLKWLFGWFPDTLRFSLIN